MPSSKRLTTQSGLSPYWRSECGRATVYVGDCQDVLAQIEREQFHAVVTDPPYGLGKEPNVVEVMKSWVERGHHEVGGGGFMGKSWDAFVPQPTTWQECVRVMKPGAHALCFAGTRTLDWMTIAIRFAGLEIRDLIMYCYGSGYPKGTNVSKAIDKVLGAEREKQRTEWTPTLNKFMGGLGVERPWKDKAKEVGYHEHDGDNPVTDLAKQWDGWNTALKPALEPIILARKPFAGTVAECVMENCCGAINVGSCRVGTEVFDPALPKKSSGSGVFGFNRGEKGTTSISGVTSPRVGRHPANLIHDGSDEVVSLFPTLTSSSAVMPLPKTPGDSNRQAHGDTDRSTLRGHDDSGSCARFFYTAKADDGDRPHGKGAKVHPTVKPLDLMKYLVRLVCAPGGTVLDPFCGSGSTGCAALAEGMSFVGIELNQEYADLAVGRLKLALTTSAAKTLPDSTLRSETKLTAPPVSKKLRGM